MANNKEKNRLTLELPDIESDALEAAAAGTGETKTRIVREALRTYFDLSTEVHDGGTVLVRKKTGEVVQYRL